MSEPALSGPDLVAGISVSDLGDGQMITGHAFGKPVLMVRRREELFAVDALCTHYSGPLGDGVLAGERVICPWHHACFDLRTGAAVAAPAMRPLTVFTTRREGDRFLVTGVVKDRFPAPSCGSAVNEVVIVGAGAAGSFAAHELRRQGYRGRLVLLTGEDDLPYDKPNLSKDYLAGSTPEEWIPLRSDEDYKRDGIELRIGARAEAIDAGRRRIRLPGSEELPFDALLLATGAEPRRLDILGADASHVFYLRTFKDSKRLIGAVANAKTAVVIGASFIGLEVAASLRTRGLDVTVVGPGERPLERVFGRDLAAFVKDVHESHGVRFRLGHKPVEIAGTRVVLDDGSEIRADVVAVGVGVSPAVHLAQATGIDVDNGIIVDAHLQTNIPGIYAAGDVARWPYHRSGDRIRVEHWDVAALQGQTAARNILGAREPFRAIPFFWSQHYDLVLCYVGHAPTWDSAEIHGSLKDGSAVSVYRRNGRVDAVATLFRDDISIAVQLAMERGDERELERVVASL